MTMSKKTLLNESQVRQFMKLAKLEPLTPGFVQGLSERNTRPPGGRASHGRGDDLDPRRRQEEGFDHLAEQPEDVEALDVDLPGEDIEAVDVEGPEEDFEAVEVEEPEEGAPSEEEVVAALEVIARAAGLEGFDMDIEADLPAEEEEEVVEPEAPEEFAPEGEEVVADMELQESDEEDLEEGSKEITDDLVEQITKRVAARILKSALTSKSTDRVDEIFGLGKPKADLQGLATRANRLAAASDDPKNPEARLSNEAAALKVSKGDEKLAKQVERAMEQLSAQGF